MFQRWSRRCLRSTTSKSKPTSNSAATETTFAKVSQRGRVMESASPLELPSFFGHPSLQAHARNIHQVERPADFSVSPHGKPTARSARTATIPGTYGDG